MELIITEFRGRSKAGVGSSHFFLQQLGHQRGSCCSESIKSRLGGGRRLWIIKIISGGAEQHIAEHGRRNQHALRSLRGHRKDDGVDEVTSQLVEHDKFSSTGRHREVMVIAESVHDARRQTCRIDEPAGPHHSLRRGELVMIVGGLNGQEFGRAHQVDACAHGFRHEGEWHAPGVDDRFARNRETSRDTGAEMRFEGVDLGGCESFRRRVAIGIRLLLNGIQGTTLFVIPRHQHCAASLDRNAGLLCVRIEEFVSPCHQSRLKRTGDAVKASVQDGRIGLGRTVANVGRPLDDSDVEFMECQCSSKRTTHHAGTHNDDVVVLRRHRQPRSWAAACTRAVARCTRARRASASCGLHRGS